LTQSNGRAAPLRKPHSLKSSAVSKRGLELSAAYAFDKAAYKRFYPIARQAGLDVMAVEEADFAKHEAAEERFLIIQMQSL
jgi:hypothetical protein